jgi:ribosomal protein L34E
MIEDRRDTVIKCSKCGQECGYIKPPPGPLDPVSYKKFEEEEKTWVYSPDQGYLCPDCYKRDFIQAGP